MREQMDAMHTTSRSNRTDTGSQEKKQWTTDNGDNDNDKTSTPIASSINVA